jgi:endonuclease-3
MSTPNRAGLLKKTFRVLKKHYKSVIPIGDRSTLEHLLYACCLENTQAEATDEAYAKLQESYFDWNEIRVTSVGELAEVLSALTDPADAATRLKQVLQMVFETYYSFDLEHLKKQNLGKAVKELQKYTGTTNFSVDYVSQNSLGGHSIATNAGAVHTMVVLGIVTESEASKRRLPGLERAISKARGIEFTSLLHQLGTDFRATPFSSRVRGILLEIDPHAKERFPKRKSRKKETPPEKEKPSKPSKTTKKAAPKKAAPKKAAPKKAAPKKAAPKKAAPKKAAPKKAASKKAASKKKTAARKTAKPKATKSKRAKAKTAKPKATKPKRTKAKAVKTKKTPAKKTKKAAAKRPAKRKPR